MDLTATVAAAGREKETTGKAEGAGSVVTGIPHREISSNYRISCYVDGDVALELVVNKGTGNSFWGWSRGWMNRRTRPFIHHPQPRP
jgi:hypothetical protein